MRLPAVVCGSLLLVSLYVLTVQVFGRERLACAVVGLALTLPVMLAVGISSMISRALSYGTIYTTKLLRRGTDVDRTTPWRALQDLKVADVMHPLRPPLPVLDAAATDGSHGNSSVNRTPSATSDGMPDWALKIGRVTYRHTPQKLFSTDTLPQALRQLQIYGRDGLPVISVDGNAIEGWLTGVGVLRAIGREIDAAQPAEPLQSIPGQEGKPAEVQPTEPLAGYWAFEVTLDSGSPASGHKLRDVGWPPGSTPVSLLRERVLTSPDPELVLAPGDRVTVLVPAS